MSYLKLQEKALNMAPVRCEWVIIYKYFWGWLKIRFAHELNFYFAVYYEYTLSIYIAFILTKKPKKWQGEILSAGSLSLFLHIFLWWK